MAATAALPASSPTLLAPDGATGPTGATTSPGGATAFGDLVAAALTAAAGAAPGAARGPASPDSASPQAADDDDTGEVAEVAANGLSPTLLLGVPAITPPLASPGVTATATSPTVDPATAAVAAPSPGPAGTPPSTPTPPTSPTQPTTSTQPAADLAPTAAPASAAAADPTGPTAPTASTDATAPATPTDATAATDAPAPAAPTAAPVVSAGPSPVVGSAAAAPRHTTSTGADAGRVAAQVIPEITTLVSRGEGVHRVTLQLNPRALGDVRVVLTMRQGDVHVRLVAGEEARAALGQSSVELSRALDRLGLGEHRILLTDPRGDAASVVVARGAAQDAGQQTDSHDPTPGRNDTHHPGGFEAHHQQQDHHSRTGAEQIAMDGVIPHRSTDPRRGSVQNSSIDVRARPGGVDLRM